MGTSATKPVELKSATLRSLDKSKFPIVLASEIGGFRQVNLLSQLYEIPDTVLSESENNSNNDAIGQLWYVQQTASYYSLINWDNRRIAEGWEKKEDLTAKLSETQRLTSQLSASLTKLQSDFSSSSTSLSNLKDSVSSLNTLVTKLQGTVDKDDEIVKNLFSLVDTLKTLTSTISTQNSENSKDISELKTKVSSLTTLQSLVDSINRYSTPFGISYFVKEGDKDFSVLEYGDKSPINLVWAYTQPIKSQKISYDYEGVASSPSPESIAINITKKTVNITDILNKAVFTLEAESEELFGQSYTALNKVTVYYKPKYFIGSSLINPTSVDFNILGVLNTYIPIENEMSPTGQLIIKPHSFDCSGGKYPVIIYPENPDLLSGLNFYLNGQNITDYVYSQKTITNSQNARITYGIYVFPKQTRSKVTLEAY